MSSSFQTEKQECGVSEGEIRQERSLGKKQATVPELEKGENGRKRRST
jgi:hypothetical protein